MEEFLIGRVAWFSKSKNFGCILCENRTCALLLGKDLLDPSRPPVTGQRYGFRAVHRKNAIWATQATPVLPLPDELTTGVPDDD